MMTSEKFVCMEPGEALWPGRPCLKLSGLNKSLLIKKYDGPHDVPVATLINETKSNVS